MDLGIYEEQTEANDQDKKTAKKPKASEKMAEIYDNKKPGAAATSSHQKPKPSLNMHKQAPNAVPELRSKSSSHQQNVPKLEPRQKFMNVDRANISNKHSTKPVRMDFQEAAAVMPGAAEGSGQDETAKLDQTECFFVSDQSSLGDGGGDDAGELLPLGDADQEMPEHQDYMRGERDQARAFFDSNNDQVLIEADQAGAAPQRQFDDFAIDRGSDANDQGNTQTKEDSNR